ncbi:hypothetical protein SP21_8 [Salmonella phage 21]|nr:hypothetical protein SP21_8 [Salmonella phage 21]
MDCGISNYSIKNTKACVMPSVSGTLILCTSLSEYAAEVSESVASAPCNLIPAEAFYKCRRGCPE